MIRAATALCVLLLAAAPASAVTQWQVTPTPDTIVWEGTDGNGTSFSGRCSSFEAVIAFDPDDLANSRIEVAIDMASCLTGEEKKDEYLPQEAWFNVADYPKAVYAASAFRHEGGNRYVAEGELTLRDETKLVLLPFTLDIEGDDAHVAGEAVVYRLDFGVGGGQLAAPDVAGLEVKVKIDLRARKE